MKGKTKNQSVKKEEKKFKEKYYICQNCGELNTETKIFGEVSSGSCGMCYCEFNNGKILNKYKRVNRKLWEGLKGLKTDKLRLKEYLKSKIKRRIKK